MISDPYDPAYRRPVIGRTYWHRPWRQTVTVLAPPGVGDAVPYDEVVVRLYATGTPAVVKLRSLEER